MEKLYYKRHDIGEINGEDGEEFIRLGLLRTENLELIKSTMVVDGFPCVVWFYLCEKIGEKFRIKHCCWKCMISKDGIWEEGLYYNTGNRDVKWSFALSEIKQPI